MLSVLLCMEQDEHLRRQASAYDPWLPMQGQRAISRGDRESHAPMPRYRMAEELLWERYKRHEDFEAINRRHTLRDKIRRDSMIWDQRKRSFEPFPQARKCHLKTLARNAQNAVPTI
jgi:hypothetical protein